jgi:uncharacterized protein involved in copper resistance
VKLLNWRILIILSLVISLSGARVALATGEHQKQENSTSTSQDMEGMDMSGDHGADHDMEGMDMSGDHGSDGQDMEGMDMEGEGTGHGHEPVTETPPSVKVLGTFGAVNLAFILVGIWNKWLRREDEI